MMPQGKPLSKSQINSIAAGIGFLFAVAIFHLPLIIAELVYYTYFGSDGISVRGPVLTIMGSEKGGFVYYFILLAVLVYNVPNRNGWSEAIRDSGRTYSKTRRRFTIAITILLWYAIVWLLSWAFISGFSTLSMHLPSYTN